MEEATEHTYEDAGRLCGVSAETIRHRAKRGKLRRGRPTNSGRPTVVLTPADIAAISAGRPAPGRPGDQPGVQPPGQPPDETAKALEVAVAALRDALERETARAVAAEMTADQQRAELDAARERERDARAALARAEEAATTVRAELAARTAGGRLARAWRAMWS